MSSPNRLHQMISMFFSTEISNYINQNNGDCEVYAAPFAVFLNKDNTTYVEPDISVICDPSKLADDGCNGAPDWIIEIVSPSSKRMDYFLKLIKYEKSGVREYWVVDSDRQIVTVYNFEKETMEEYSFSDTVPVGIYESFSIDMSRFSNTGVCNI